MKQITLLMIALLALFSALVGQGLETFDNFDYTGTSYIDGSFVGNNGITWNYLHATGSVAGTNDNSIDGTGMILRRSEVPSKIYSNPIPNGIGNFSVQLRKAYTGAGDRQAALYINNEWIADSIIFGSPTGGDPTVHVFSVDGINIEGNVIIEIRNIQGGSVNRQFTVDNITWTAYGTGDPTCATPTFSPVTGLYFEPQTVSISCSTPDATIFYTTDGSVPTTDSAVYSAPITISQTTVLKAMATAAGFLNSNVSTATYTFPIQVPDVATLRTYPADNLTVYALNSEVVVTFLQTYRNQKYVQDATAAILIDDFNNVLQTTYNLYDGITGITGRLNVYAGMLQFTPVVTGAPATSTNNPVLPLEVSYNQLINAFEDFEARLVRVMGVTITGTGNFVNGTIYPSTDGADDYSFRTTFYDVNYIGSPIPGTPQNIVGIPNSRAEGEFFTARFLSDFEDAGGAPNSPSFDPPSGSYYQPISVVISTNNPEATIYYTLDGSDPTTGSPVYSTPISLTENTTLKAFAVLDGFDPSAISTATYFFPTPVSNLAELRQSTLESEVYKVTGEVIVTFKQSYRNQIFIQDSGAGILIDDPNGSITTQYNIGDGITGLVGVLSEYGNMLQFTPALDPGTASSTGNIIEPLTVSVMELETNFEAYEARMVKLNSMFFITDQSEFATGQVYNINSAESNMPFNLRTAFFDVDYIGTDIPLYFNDIAGIATATANGNFITPRSLSDMAYYDVPAPVYISAEFESPNLVNLYWSYSMPESRELPHGLEGYCLYRNDVPILNVFNIDGDGFYYTDTISTSDTYTYYVMARFMGGFLSLPTQSVVVNVVSNPEDVSSLVTALSGNYPNPFNPTTSIVFSVKEPAQTVIDIYNVKGQKIKTLVNSMMSPGNHTVQWNGNDENGNPVSSGVYYYKMRSGKYSNTRKMLLLK